MLNNKIGNKMHVDKEKYKNAVYSNDKSLKRANPFGEKSSGKIDMVKQMARMKKQMGVYKEDIEICSKSLEDNLRNPKETAGKDFIKKFEEYAYKLGVGDIGYTKVSPELLLEQSVALYPNAIVVTLQMDKEKIDKSPSQETYEMMHDTYARLNKIANELTDFVRKHGYGAQAGLAIGTMVCHYPWLAERAGIGFRGRSGMLITPQFGPRQRLAVIFTSINDLNFYDERNHEWIKDFCNKCGKCSRECPGNAIISASEKDEHGKYKHLDARNCTKNYGCCNCIKVCLFNNVSYEKLKDNFLKIKK